MNSDIRIAVSFLDHPKTVKLQRRRGDGAILCLIRLWCYVAENKPDGGLAGMDAEDIEIAAKWGGVVGEFTAELVELGFIESRDGTYFVHDWPEHNPYAYHAKDRQARARLAAQAKHARSSKVANGEHAGSLPLAGFEHAPSPVPSPSPEPVPEPEPAKQTPLSGSPPDIQGPAKKLNGYKDQAIEVINFLNEKTGRNFRGVEANGRPTASLEQIIARLRSGATVQDCKTVIARKHRDWAGKEEMQPYLRPETLFGRKKFESYLGECTTTAMPKPK